MSDREKCRWCQARVAATQDGLCRICSPAGKPVISRRRWCLRCESELNPKCKSVYCAYCQEVLRLLKKGSTVDTSKVLFSDLAWQKSRQIDSGPTSVAPGSLERLAVLIARYEKGEPLWHAHDQFPDLS